MTSSFQSIGSKNTYFLLHNNVFRQADSCIHYPKFELQTIRWRSNLRTSEINQFHVSTLLVDRPWIGERHHSAKKCHELFKNTDANNPHQRLLERAALSGENISPSRSLACWLGHKTAGIREASQEPWNNCSAWGMWRTLRWRALLEAIRKIRKKTYTGLILT